MIAAGPEMVSRWERKTAKGRLNWYPLDEVKKFKELSSISRKFVEQKQISMDPLDLRAV